MKLQRSFFMLLIATLALPALSFAQGGVPGDPVDVPAPQQTDIPFDGLTTLLLAASAGYAIKKGKMKKKKERTETIN